MNRVLESLSIRSVAFVVPLGAGLLVLPFTGARNALVVFALATAAMLLHRVYSTTAVVAVRSSAAGSIARLRGLLITPALYLKSTVVLAAVCIILLILPHLLNDYYRDIMTLTGMYIVLALGLNIIVGQTGLLNLGYVAFYAIGAYTYAILSTQFGLSFWPGLVASARCLPAWLRRFSAMLTLRLRGDYFAIVTLGLGEITRIILNNWDLIDRRAERNLAG